MRIWVKYTEADAEYNEHRTIVDNKLFIIYSDIDGEKWSMTDPQDETTSLNATDVDEAISEANKEIKEYLKS